MTTELLRITHDDLKLNDRHTVSGNLTWDMVQASSAIPEKRRLYQLAQRDTVPMLAARFTDVDATLPDALRGYVTLRLALVALELPVPDAYETFIDAPHVLLEWLLDARTTNEYDDVRRYLLEQPPDQRRNDAPLPAHIESFVYARLERFPDFRRLRRVVLACTPLWDNLQERQYIENWLLQQTLAKRIWAVEAVHWAPYIKHVLYNQRQSLLYDAERWVGNNSLFDIVVVGFDPAGGGGSDETQHKRYWVSLLTRYRKENPNAKEESETSLSDRPHDYDVLSRHTISLVALDRRRADRRMCGYVTCTLSAVHQLPEEQAEPFKSTELNLFVERLRENNRLRKQQQQQPKDAGYDVFSVDGVHVHNDYRGVGGLSKILMFYALEFIRVAQPVLGVSLLMAGAEAQATKAILGGSFGFSHFNCYNDLRWLWNQATQYYEVRRPVVKGDNLAKKRASNSDVPLQLLTRPQLLRSLEQLLKPEKYNFIAAGLQQVYDTLTAVQTRLRESLVTSPVDPVLREDDTQAWPDPLLFMTARQFNDKVLEPLRLCVDDTVNGDDIEGGPVGRNAALGKAYHMRVNTLLGTDVDNQDCFLFLGNSSNSSSNSSSSNNVKYDGIALLSQKMLAFYEIYKGGGGGGGNNNTDVTNWVDDVFASRAHQPRTNKTGVSTLSIGSGSDSGSDSGDGTSVTTPNTRGINQQEAATDEDLALYTLWLQDERKNKNQKNQNDIVVLPSLPPTTKPPTIMIDLTADEEKETAAIDEAVRLRKELRRVDQAYLQARTDHERVGAPLVKTFGDQFFKAMRAASPSDWSDDRVMALARTTARTHLHKTGQHREFPSRKDWVAQHHPHLSPYF